uniref:suppressor of cytokine signaling 1-like n=1 Tax=Oncorhynchus gorbuscha TaxID=8017 RepID=UPI001EAEB381
IHHTPPGSFLIRDSSQPDVFFTLSYHGDRGPVSVRVLLTSQSFRLNGSNKAFDSLFSLLRFYVESSHRRLRRAWRRERPMTLQQLCRGRIVELYGAERIDSLPGLNQVVIQYLQDYPYSI